MAHHRAPEKEDASDGNLSGRRGDGDRLRGDLTEGRGQGSRTRLDESRAQGDRAWSERFGRGNDRRVGDANGLDTGRDVAGRDFRGNREFGDRSFSEEKYQSWRQGASRGVDGRVGDYRDKSGNWKDGDRFAAADQIRDHWRGDWNDGDVPFHSGWKGDRWHGDHDHWNHWGYWGGHHHHGDDWFWWAWATAPLLTSWLHHGHGWSTPYYWDYGPGEYMHCYNDVVYVNGEWYQPAPVYHEQVVAIAEQAPDWTAEQAQQAEWLPLGVFAVARDGVPDTTMLMQLAVTKDGVISGTASNQATAASFPIEGTVDKQTQRAVWKYTDDKNQPIVVETSVYNLTQSESTGMAHYGPDNIQVVELVRLEKPEAAGAAETRGVSTSAE